MRPILSFSASLLPKGLIIMFFLLPSCLRAPRFGEQVVICGDDKLQVIRTATSDTSRCDVVWEWKASDGEAVWGPAFTPHFHTLDECKVVDGGKKLLVTASSGGVCLLDMATKQVLFYAEAPMAHSADLLPGGRIAVALSVNPRGNSLELYDVTQPCVCLFRDSLLSGHGAVWMEEQERLYVLGNEIRAYALKDWDTATPSLTCVGRWKGPTRGGHDLTRISAHELLLTNPSGVHVFDTDDGSFHDFPPLKDVRSVKSVNYDPATGQVIYTKAEISWWTHHVYSSRPDWHLTVDSINVYKVRVFR